MLEKLRNKDCADCEFGDHCRDIRAEVCTVGEGSPTSPLMIIAEVPDREDALAGTVMRSSKDGLLRKILRDGLGLKDEDVYITYLVKCKSNRIINGEDVVACMKYVHAEIAAVKPKVILTLGELAMVVLCEGKVSNLTRIRGEMMLKELNGHKFKLIPTFSCGYIARLPTQFKNFAFDIDKAWSEATGTRTGSRRSKCKIIETLEEVDELFEMVKEVGVCCFDFETHNLETHHGREINKATGLAISFQPGSAYFIPLEHFESPFEQRDAEMIVEMFNELILANPDIRKIAHNLTFDLHVARMYSRYPKLTLRGRLDDTVLMSHLYDETTPNKLKDLVREYFRAFGDYEKEIEKYGKNFASIPLKELAPYACYDADLTHRLCVMFEHYLLQDERLYAVYRNEIMPAFKVLFEAECNGVLVDKEYLFSSIKAVKGLIEKNEKKIRAYKQVKNFEKEMNDFMVLNKIQELNVKLVAITQKREAKEEELTTKNKKIPPPTKTEEALKEKIADLKSGRVTLYEGVNFGSPVQLGKLFYTVEGFGFEQIQDSRSGEWLSGTGKEVLIDIKDDTGFIEDLQVWRSLDKTLSTYLEGIEKRVDRNDYLHTSFLQHGTATGRLSSRNPNLQNLPNEGKIANEDVLESVRRVKKSIIVPERYTLVQLDYSQAELRLIAEFAEDPTMIEAYANDHDLHALTASKLVKKTLEQFMALPKDEQKKWRTRAKAGNFGLIYKISAGGFQIFAKNNYKVWLTLEECEDFIKIFFGTYKKIRAYHELYIAKAQKFGYVRTLFGRKRNLPDIHSSNSMKQGMDERASVNSPIQGTAGEFTIFASAVIKHRVDPKVKFALNIHDALYYYVPDELVETTVPVMKRTMEDLPIQLYFERALKHVTMKVDVETSKKNLKETEAYDFG